ncbi:16S rRNA (cytidine(1402)-2'-O)-methyltransferase [Lachnospiraceae bacterium OttesenSCG-928-J05]|nr:16S rRNA (cytidine(1402)-2'-O)-methyltransferase [Lachnospiraceae bacterium OttesenSCG-928-J05]
MPGTLYLCATPIGNLEDMTFRVVNCLKTVDLIAAEDTRNSKKLLNHFEIATPMTSYHEHNKYDKAKILIEKLAAGQNIALITDAGTPGISDPGEVLVRLCYEEGIEVTALPGGCAFVLALILSGLSTRRFVFEAFLPREKKEKEKVLKELEQETRTIVLYEAPHRLLKTLESLYGSLGDREIAVVRELTKRYEEVKRVSLSEGIAYYQEHEVKGEIVLVIAGRDRKELEAAEVSAWEKLSVTEHMEYYLEQGIDKKEAMKKVAKDRNLTKRDIYQELLELKKEEK